MKRLGKYRWLVNLGWRAPLIAQIVRLASEGIWHYEPRPAALAIRALEWVGWIVPVACVLVVAVMFEIELARRRVPNAWVVTAIGGIALPALLIFDCVITGSFIDPTYEPVDGWAVAALRVIVTVGVLIAVFLPIFVMQRVANARAAARVEEAEDAARQEQAEVATEVNDWMDKLRQNTGAPAPAPTPAFVSQPTVAPAAVVPAPVVEPVTAAAPVVHAAFGPSFWD